MGIGFNSTPQVMSDYGLLRSDVLISHANGAYPKDAELLCAAGAHVSSTPDTEIQMALGMPVAFRPDMQKISSLGIDCIPITHLISSARHD